MCVCVCVCVVCVCVCKCVCVLVRVRVFCCTGNQELEGRAFKYRMADGLVSFLCESNEKSGACWVRGFICLFSLLDEN